MDRPVVVLIGSAPWHKAAQLQLEGLGYRVHCYREAAGYVARLTDDHAALILVDGSAGGWQYWVTTPKVSPATRRIPVVLVAADPALRGAGEIAGADLMVEPGALIERLPDIVARAARVLSEEVSRQLRAACRRPLPPRAREAVALFNAGEYYRQHDLFEALWREEEGPVRDLYRAILQVGVAYYQLKRGNVRGARKILLRSFQWLNMLPDVCQGVDVARLRGDAHRLREALETLPDDSPDSGLDPALFGSVHLVE